MTPETAKVRNAVAAGLAAARVGAGDLVLVACSGGQDSLALAIAAAFVGKREGIQVGAVVVDHQLQPDSAAVAEQAALKCQPLGLGPVLVRRVNIEKRGEGLEAAARTARYLEIEAARKELGAKYVLLGHTLDDQAETVLLGLSRGSGVHSISGMSPILHHLLRPLLQVSRLETAAACRAAGLEPWSDPHNFDSRFSRVRIRQRIMPQLEQELGPGIAEALARTAALARADDLELAAQADAALTRLLVRQDPATLVLRVAELAKLSSPISSRIVLLALRQLSSVASYTHITAVLELVTNWHGQQPLDLPGVKVERAGDELIIRATKRQPPSRDEAEQLER